MLDLEKNTVVYVTRDIERASGLPLNTSDYYIISNLSDFAKDISNGLGNALLIDEDKQLDTWQLLKNEKVITFINNLKNPNIVVFKNTPQIERICEENNWNLLNPSAKLSNIVEEKLSQINWLDDLQKYLPKYKVDLCENIEPFESSKDFKPFILQFNRAHTGSGTILIKSEHQLKEIQEKFPQREVRVSEYIEGPVFTSNNVVTKNKTLIGNISYQITGLQPFTDNPFTTIGNDWGVVKNILNEKEIEEFEKITTDIGNKLIEDGWKGLFGVDIILEEETGKLFLIEINARQPASTSYESTLQKDSTTFEAHLRALLDLDIEELKVIEDGAQIVQRVTKEIPSLHDPKYNKRPDFKIIKYNNTKPNSDLMRTQTLYSLIDAHNKLSREGLKIIDFITVTKKGAGWDMPRGSILAIKDKKIILMERQKYSQHFFTPPGGTKEGFDKDILETAKREGKEETNLDFTIPKQEPLHFNINGRNEYYFFAENISGEAKLGEEEKERSNKNNSYKLVWVDIKELSNIKLLPKGLTEQLLNLID
ncbi:ATP-grasp domain-containing protein [Candidatus Parcubacteria bacterium]|jgi:predicted ATP-grasp superfamily ATP-dependent carboligase/ADP-ribose pyrophosphatase YjhB (NUDIX family)|nr:ATP-grasp domain-containing protein [Candidatus Parcubacteria bacterium]MBT3948597.1 ATP-grasp domain-containing protein [Candidatus Parcubacteria bacterium]